jgi:predicted transglutaminase-like cysteine proteinase
MRFRVPIFFSRRLFGAVLVLVACALAAWSPVRALQFNKNALQSSIQSRYGQTGVKNLNDWLALLAQLQGKSELEQVKAVNDFWNLRVRPEEDIRVWRQTDYWATPLESLGRQQGDCEDFVIGKYFSLRYLGIAPEKLRFVYVRAMVGGQSVAHMVLGYYPDPAAEPLVLDSLITDIRPAGRRPDLTPVFSFNAEGVYVQGARPTPADRLGRWRDLLDRMRREGFQP